MEALTKGFCAASLVQSQTPKEMEAWRQQWPHPTLQVVDIQRYPPFTRAALPGPSRFYVAVSDSESVAWLVVPPCTAVEDAVAAFEIEIGCCITLLRHVLVTAANGLNVIVPLNVRYSNSTHRLLGEPRCAEALFQLSAQSLFQRQDAGRNAICPATATLQRPSHRIAIRDFVDAPQRALGNWGIAARVVWRGREYPLNPKGSRPGSNSATCSSGSAGDPRFLLRCLLADEHGDAIVAIFVGGETLMECIRLHGCYRLARGVVRWGTDESGAPIELHFVEKSIEEELTAEFAQQVFPFNASAVIGEVGKQLISVAAAIETAEIGGCVSVVGTVVEIQGSTQISTKRGRVWRSVVTLADTGDESAHAGSSSSGQSLDVTLWGDVAEAAQPALGERWVFHPCTVQLFQRRKTLSSRSSTMAVKLVPHKDIGERASLASVTALGEGDGCGADTVTRASCANDPTADARAVKKDMQFVLDLQESSPTLPLLARVQKVVPPLLKWVCTECSRTQQQGVASDSTATAIPTVCAHCSAMKLAPKLHMRVWLSDCIRTALATVHGCAAEALLEASPAEVAQYLQRRSQVPSEILDRLVGLPLLVWLLPCGAADPLDAPQFTVVNCKRLHYIFGAYTLLSAIDSLSSFGEDVNGSPADFSVPKPSVEDELK
ncbi:hypothetical protein JKF63_01982 [Porcisia hertigi]|uniref:Uncharacterized protein n=1 Tax=Porcisia hertigi TaxID=2761500 RepID=A0A836HX74_9TRYP|nr:hypothetical protein JKF63_01982 [Porcisia hertigi]